MIALLADLQSKWLVGQTLVVLGTEFDDTLPINDNDERDHHDEITCLLTRVGIRTDNFEGTPWQAAVLDQA